MPPKDVITVSTNSSIRRPGQSSAITASDTDGYKTAGANRVVFNLKGNDYRLVVAVAYRFAALYIKFVGTHAQYDMIDAATVENHS